MRAGKSNIEEIALELATDQLDRAAGLAVEAKRALATAKHKELGPLVQEAIEAIEAARAKVATALSQMDLAPSEED